MRGLSRVVQDVKYTETDAEGNYHLPELPPGIYTLRFEKENYQSHARADLPLRRGRALRVNVNLLASTGDEEVMEHCGPGLTFIDSGGAVLASSPLSLGDFASSR
ncbi:carboxypeptidase-like regulatory domain-containing protein [Pyxidicoccus fallax]|nr:carboxypeptidase-like regulatory domain-containing protein [Pyxidicoccus fallax]